MARKLNDFSQLTKAMLRKNEPRGQSPKTVSASTPIPHPSKASPLTKAPADESPLSPAEADCLAYFSHTSIADSRYATAGRMKTATVPKRLVAPASMTDDVPKIAMGMKETRENVRPAAEVEDLRQQLAAMERRALVAERVQEAHAAEVAAWAHERTSFTSQIKALRARVAELSDVDRPAAPAPVELPQSSAPRAATSVLAPPKDFVEIFPGEVREMVVAALKDACETALQSTRERRAAVLEAVLAANPSSGELERRRVLLRQILKDAAYVHDAQTLKAVERLGMRLISGKKHWKLEYGNVRMPMSKTPSDWRASLNSSADMANRCF